MGKIRACWKFPTALQNLDGGYINIAHKPFKKKKKKTTTGMGIFLKY